MTAIYILLWLGIACIAAWIFGTVAKAQSKDRLTKIRRAGF